MESLRLRLLWTVGYVIGPVGISDGVDLGKLIS